MIDPDNITNYDLDQVGLQYHIIFCILVAGKSAKIMARVHENLRDMLTIAGPTCFPFSVIKRLGPDVLADYLKQFGCGCFVAKAKAICAIAESGLDLRLCTTYDLEEVYGIGPKTSRYFILHTRKNARCAALDRHILRWLREEIGLQAPKATPMNKAVYAFFEEAFLNLADAQGKTPAQLDLEIWKKYRV